MATPQLLNSLIAGIGGPDGLNFSDIIEWSGANAFTSTVDLSGATTTYEALSISNAEIAAAAAIVRSKMAQEDLAVYNINLYSLRQADQAPMGITGTTGDHFYDIATNSPVLFGNTPSSTTVTDISTFDFQLPPEYVDGETVTVRITAQVSATSDTNTLDLEAYEVTALSGAVGSDINATTIKTMTSSAVAYDFTITPTTLVAGDLLHFLMTSVNQDADGSDGILSIHAIQVLCDIKG